MWTPAGGAATRPLIMIHIDKGGDKQATKAFFDRCLSHGIEFDVIGQSYYPWWHGTLPDLRENLAFMANEYHKDIYVVEAAYNWRPAEYRNKPAPFPETPEGQRAFLEAVNQAVQSTPGGHGKGVFCGNRRWAGLAAILRAGACSTRTATRCPSSRCSTRPPASERLRNAAHGAHLK